MPTLLTNVADILKKDISPEVMDLMPKQKILMSQIKKNQGVEPLGTDKFYVSLRTGRIVNGTASENATIYKGQVAYDQSLIQCKWNFISIEVSDQMLDATKQGRGSLKNMLKELPLNMASDLAKNENVILNGYGTGQLALVNGTTGSQTVITVDTPGTRYLEPGQYIDINGDAATILTVDSETQITLAGAITVADNEVIKPYGCDDPMGILGYIDDGDYVGTFQNILHTVPYWKSYCEDTAEELDLDMIRKGIRKAKQYARGKMFVITGEDLYGKVGTLLSPYLRSADLREKLVGWDEDGIQLTPGVGLFLDYDCWDGMMFGIDTASITIGELTPFAWLEAPLAGIFDKVADKANYVATGKHYWNLAGKDPRANFRLSGKTV